MKLYAAHAKFIGAFPGTKTQVSFNTTLPQAMAEEIAQIPAKCFHQAMEEEYPDKAIRPRLHTITVTLRFKA